MAFTEPPAEGELSTAAEIEAARREFLGSPPPILDPEAGEAPAPAASEEDAAIDELLTQPPAALEGAPAPAPAPAAAGSDPFAAYGGEEQVRIAMQVQEALRTENGIRALVANGLTALGYDVEQVRQALDAYEEGTPAGAPAAADPFAGFEDDDPITVAQARQLAEQTAQQAAQAALAQTQSPLGELQQVIQQQQNATVRAATDTACVEVLGPIPADPAAREAYARQVDAIVARGQAYYDPSQWANPDHIKQAVQRAHTEIEAENNARFQAFLQTKRATRAGQPPNIAGGAGTEGALPEPKTMADARKQAEAAGFFK